MNRTWLQYEASMLPRDASILIVGGGVAGKTAATLRAAGCTNLTDTDEATGTRVQDIVGRFGAKAFDVVVAQDVLQVLHGSYEEAIAAMFSVARNTVIVDEDMPLELSDETHGLTRRIATCCRYGRVRVVHSTDTRMTLVFSVGVR